MLVISLQTIKDSTEVNNAIRREDIVMYPTSENQVCIYVMYISMYSTD